VQTPLEIQVGRPFSAHAGDAPPPQLAAGSSAPPLAPPAAPNRSQPLDPDRTNKIRFHLSQPSQKNRSTLSVSHISPFVFPKLTCHPLLLKSIYEKALSFMF
jgi:hypothetical protein